MDAINKMLSGKDDFLITLQDNITKVISQQDHKVVEDIDARLKDLQNELLRLANSKADYEEVAEEIYRLREQKQKTLIANAEREGKRQRIDEMTEFLHEQLVRKLVKKVTVHEDKINIEFKSGVEVDLDI